MVDDVRGPDKGPQCGRGTAEHGSKWASQEALAARGDAIGGQHCMHIATFDSAHGAGAVIISTRLCR